MARNHENSPDSTNPQDDGDEKKASKQKKRSGFAVPIPAETPEKPAAEKPKRTALDEALANLAIKKREAAEVKPEEAKEEAAEPEAGTEAEESAVDTPEVAQDEPEDKPEADAETEKLEEQEVRPNEFSGGEVIIHLQGDQPVAERVIPLHDELEEPTVDSSEQVEQQMVYAEQPVEQHEKREEIPPEVKVAHGGEVPPPLPPERPQLPAEQPPEPERPVIVAAVEPRPEDIYESVVPNPNFAAVAAPNVAGGERPATKQEVEDAIYYATKSGQNRGALTGLLVGGAYEHFKHKRREKRQENRFKKQTKQFEQSRADQHFFFDEQAKRQLNTEQRFTAAENRFGNHTHPEKPVVPTTELPPVESSEQLNIPTDHRLETSAWHSIEIDKKTGKAVENPAFTYGQEYYRERAQEAAPKQQRNAAAGEVALVAAALAQSTDASSPQLPTTGMPIIPDASIQGVPARDAFKQSNTPTDQDVTSQGPLWPWIVALVVVVVCLIAALG